MPHEIEARVINNRIMRVYKNLQPSLRIFWLENTALFKDATYVVLGSQRLTFKQSLELSLKAAAIFESKYGIQKGDRVGICARNLPEYLVAFWACHLLGAVTVLVNAWLPSEPLQHCITHTGCKLLLLDYERADRIQQIAPQLRAAGVAGFIVLDAPDSASERQGFELWQTVMNAGGGNPQDILARDPKIEPEDNATIIFTSGTTGLPKGVLSTQRQFLINHRNASVASSRAKLRRGEDLPQPQPGPQRGILVSVPLFHVTGSTSLTMLATSIGVKVVFMRKWDAQEAARLIKAENIRVAGGVPSMVADLVESGIGPEDLDSLLFGGAAAPLPLPGRAKAAFPKTVLSQGYGMTETNSGATGVADEDYELRPTSVGLPSPINDVIIVRDGVIMPRGEVGEIWIRGANVMQCYWGDPETTKKTVTDDGWCKTGDSGEMDVDGFIYLRDRMKDMIIRGGENISSVTVENAIYDDVRVNEVAAVGVPDEKLGELVTAVVSTKPAHHGKVKEFELIELARSKLPHFAVPVMVIIQSEPFQLTPSAKIIKAPLRALARQEWERRKGAKRTSARL